MTDGSRVGKSIAAHPRSRNYGAIPSIAKLSNYPHVNGAIANGRVFIRGSFRASRSRPPMYALARAMEARLRRCNSPKDGVEQPVCQKKVSLYRGYF